MDRWHSTKRYYGEGQMKKILNNCGLWFSSSKDYEIVKEENIWRGKKIIAKKNSVRLEISIIKIKKEDVENYIRDKKEELSRGSINIPTPYEPTLKRHIILSEFAPFFKTEEIEYGVGYADAEFNKVIYSKNQLVRYRYFVTWRLFEERGILLQIEVYTPLENFNEKRIKNIVTSIRMKS